MGSNSLDLQLNLQEDMPTILGDRSRLAQSLQNLLNNAVQYTPQGGIF